MSGSNSTSSVSTVDPEAQDELPPEDPRFAQLRRLVSILLVVLIVGISAVVIALLLKLKELSFAPPPPAVAHEQRIPGLKPGERLISASADVDRITIVLEDAGGKRRAVVLDGRSFRPLGAVAD